MRTGQKVVCVKTHSKGLVVKGRHYTITGVFSPCACGPLVSVGINGFYDTGMPLSVGRIARCPKCYQIHHTPSEEALLSPMLFRPIIEDLTAELANKEAERIVIERPEHINEPQPAQP